jgi:glycosyltransferase involved in cell wall biosynthesis
MSQDSKNHLCILQVSALDRAGGAEQIAWNLFNAYRQLGISSWMAVGKKRSTDPNVFVIKESSSSSWWATLCLKVSNALNPFSGKVRGVLRFQAFMKKVSKGSDWFADLRGEEDFYFPGSWTLLKQSPKRSPTILHLHNLHGGYFDPRALSGLSSRIPVMLTLHDAWLLSGNCAHSFGCQRWKTGCGECPDISIYPGLKVDSTHLNWRRRKTIFEQSRLYIAAPCQWLLDKAKESILAPAIVEGRVIYNGVDTSIFYPGDKSQARMELGLPSGEKILLFVANGIKSNPFKDYATLRKTIEFLGAQIQSPLHFIALGEEGEQERVGLVTIHYIPRTIDTKLIAQYYRASDLYIHPAKAETFPNSILEAMACGVPVVASNVGGISEQVDDGVTGFLIPAQNPELMAKSVNVLLNDPTLMKRMGEAASQKVKHQFTLENQVEQYIAWYDQIRLRNKSL